MSDIEDKLTKAKAKMILKMPFFATIANYLPMVEAPWLWPPTMATDMKTIFYHPQFVEDCSTNEIIAVICHEVMHVAYLHGTRRGARDHRVWNLACDYAINPILIDAGLKLPGKFLFEERFRNMTAQAIYAELMKEKEKLEEMMKGLPSMSQGGQGGQGQGGGDKSETIHGGVMDAPSGEGSGSVRTLEAEIKIKVNSAYAAAKSRGNVPAGIEGLIEAIGKPSINWHEYIQTWVKGHNPDDYTWQRPRRTMLANHRVYMPSLEMRGAGVGVLSIDTSGSVSDDELRKYIREIVGIIEMCKPDRLILIQHDAIVQKVEEWEFGDDFSSLKVKGRGGTCIRPVFDYVANLDEPIDWMICFTDCGIGDYPKPVEAPDFPILWAATGPDNTPFGTYIPIKDAMD